MGTILARRLNWGNVRSRCLRGGREFWTIFRECVIRFYNWNANVIYQTNEVMFFFPCFFYNDQMRGSKKKERRECSRRGSKASSKTKAFCKSYIKRDGYSQNHYLTILKMDFGNDIGIFFITFRRLIALCAYIDISISCFFGGGIGYMHYNTIQLCKCNWTPAVYINKLSHTRFKGWPSG